MSTKVLCAVAKHSLFLTYNKKQTAYLRDQGNQTPNNSGVCSIIQKAQVWQQVFDTNQSVPVLVTLFNHLVPLFSIVIVLY